MWDHGYFTLDGEELFYQAKVYEEGSKYGINGGRVSKLGIRFDDEVKQVIVYYDREWVIKPKTELANKALNHVLELYK